MSPNAPRPSGTRFRRSAGLGLLLALCAGLDAEAATLDLEPCRLTDREGLAGVRAECGALRVPEDPERPDGPVVELFVARIPALVDEPRDSAFSLIQGGPGGSSIDAWLQLRGAFEGVRRHRDVVLVDQRGTGRSLALRCPETDADPTLELDPARATRLAEACLDALPRDPAHFTTSIAVQDLDAVRAALGLERLDVYGVSYGTRVALHYLRRHPERVRTLVLDGVAPPGWYLGPDIARFGQDSLDALFARCAEAPACSERFGDVGTRFDALHARLQDAPQRVEIADPVTARPREILFGPEALALAVRLLSYQPETRALLPLLIDDAAAGRLAPLAAQAEMAGRGLADAIAIGMHNAVVCTEDLPFVDGPAPDAEGTYLGPRQLDAMRALCAPWPRGTLDADFHEPVASDVPTLLLSGEFDPVTPPANAARAAETLSNARLITAPGQGHGVVMRGCLPRLLAEFVEGADPDALDARCVDRLTAPPFFVDYTGPMP